MLSCHDSQKRVHSHVTPVEGGLVGYPLWGQPLERNLQGALSGGSAHLASRKRCAQPRHLGRPVWANQDVPGGDVAMHHPVFCHEVVLTTKRKQTKKCIYNSLTQLLCRLPRNYETCSMNLAIMTFESCSILIFMHHSDILLPLSTNVLFVSRFG